MENHNTCWSCHGALNENALFCDFCGVVQSPKLITPFELFDITPSFTVDKLQIEQKYLSLQKKLHPDNFVTKPPSEQMYAMSAGANLNDAYEILMDNVKLSCQLLEINGFNDVLSGKPSVQLMTEQFELREMLDEVDSLETLQQQVAKKVDICYKKITEAFANNNNEEAAEKTIELHFLSKFAKDVKRKRRKQI